MRRPVFLSWSMRHRRGVCFLVALLAGTWIWFSSRPPGEACFPTLADSLLPLPAAGTVGAAQPRVPAAPPANRHLNAASHKTLPARQPRTAHPAPDTPTVLRKYPAGTVVDLARADTTELQRIPGIGSTIARRIVGYRKRLGGFHDVAQVLEVPGVTPPLAAWFRVGKDTLHRLPVNRASSEQLRAHPYLNARQAERIIRHRRKRGKLDDLAQLALYKEFTESDLQRLEPYLSFE